ncbi:MAG: DMT family transporter [Beijerinckiaceae bacterium]|nr:DMT family transporter [Beijerinckiaceae bacterium]
MNPFLGIFFKVLSGLSFTMMSASVKWLGTSHPGETIYPVGEVVFFRSFLAMWTVVAWLAWRGKLKGATLTNNRMGHIQRGLVGSFGMFFGFAALSLLPLPDATAINYIVPLITVMLAALVLKETVGVYRWSAVGVGMIGVAVMLWPHLSFLQASAPPAEGASFGAACGLMAALCTSFAMIEVRKLTATEKTGTIVLYFSALTSVFGALTILLGFFDVRYRWLMPTGLEAGLMIMIGVFGGIGQITLTESYRHAEPSVIAPFDYLNLVWALIIGWVLFAETPDEALMIGASIVIAAGLFVILREHQLGIKRKREKAAAPSRPI